MIRVEFLGPIGKKPLEIDATTLREVSDLLQQNEALADWLPKCAVALNDMMVNDLDTPLKAGDKITILPPVCGG